MTDNPDNEGFNLDEESFDNLEGKKGSIGAMWKDKPMFKVGVVVAAAALIFGTIILFGGSDEQKPGISLVPEGTELTAPPGTEEASPAYIEAVKEQNEARTEEAERTGTSSLPTPIDPPVGTIAIPEDAAGQEDPLQRWRKLQEERLEREMQRTQALAPQALPEEDANRQQAIQDMAAGMAAQMQSLLDSRNQRKTGYKSLTTPDYLEKLKEEEKRLEEEQEDGVNDAGPVIQEILLPAGQIAYAQLITEANSDAPGPVLAQIAGGVLNGGRLIGDFQVMDKSDKLTLRFSTIVLDGISYSVSAIALDPATTLPAMATDVDHHYFKRVVLPAAAAFVEGMASAISESGRTSVTVEGDTVAEETEETTDEQEVASGIQEAGQELSEIIDEAADETETTIIIASGTQIGVLFLQPVTKDQSTEERYSVHPSFADVNPSAGEVAASNAGQ
jgi:intracellular multiplication protein IcmE